MDFHHDFSDRHGIVERVKYVDPGLWRVSFFNSGAAVASGGLTARRVQSLAARELYLLWH
jgi:hypothetical protein